MEAPVKASGESAFLAVKGGHNAVAIDEVEARPVIRSFFEPGQRVPLHRGALAGVLLAHRDPAQIDREPNS